MYLRLLINSVVTLVMIAAACANQKDATAVTENEQSQRQVVTQSDPGAVPQQEKAEAAPTTLPAPLTVADQSNAPEDLRLSSEIRKAIVNDPRLSFSAKNVLVISRERQVTLRGLVTPEEHASLIDCAHTVAGVRMLNDLLVEK